MVVNAVKIQPMGHEDELVDVGYAHIVSLEPKPGDALKGQPNIGEILVAAALDGLVVIYTKNKRQYELKLNLLGDTPQITQEDVTPLKQW